VASQGSHWTAPFVNNNPYPASKIYSAKRTLVAGTGGGIGAILTGHRFLVLLDNSEQNLREMDITLSEGGFAIHAAILGDVRDVELLRKVFEMLRERSVAQA